MDVRSGASDVSDVFRDASGSAVATLIRVFGDISVAEDAVQDAFEVAINRWPADGLPANPAGWIVTTARRRAIDRLRRTKRGRELETQAQADPSDAPMADMDIDFDADVIPDDQLRLVFTCCHPALRTEHQIALTLRLLGGLSIEEVARSFLVAESTMTKRLVRAKYKIKAANIPYRIPAAAELPGRLRSVLAVIYLIYNAGADDPSRAGLRAEAIRLGRSLAELMPDEPEVSGLVALLLLTEARMPARFDANGELVRLRDQDRHVWDRALVDEGHAMVRSLVRRNQPGPYQLQAAIQAVHDDATEFRNTDWRQIVTLYDQLIAVMPTPVVALNRAIALGEVEGPEVLLAALSDLEESLSSYHLFHATRGEALARLGRTSDALDSFRAAHELAPTEVERQFLRGRMNQLRA